MMPLIQLPSIGIVILDIAAWYFFHLFISWIARLLPDDFFERHAEWFQTKRWEQDGFLWQRLFRVRSWKNKLPDGTQIIKKGFDKRHLLSVDHQGLSKFIIETQRAELTHWLLIPPALLFFIWNPLWAGWMMIVYALLVNVPFILIQRFNRPRLERLRKKASRLQSSKITVIS